MLPTEMESLSERAPSEARALQSLRLCGNRSLCRRKRPPKTEGAAHTQVHHDPRRAETSYEVLVLYLEVNIWGLTGLRGEY
jgi:hypothetical protein